MRGKTVSTIIASVLICFTVAGSIQAGTLISTSTVTISATVPAPYVPPIVPPPSGGGGGGGGSAPVETRVIFSGLAYPMSRITVIKNAVQTVSTLAGPDGNFSINLGGLESGWLNFMLYAEDNTNRRSASYSLPIFVSPGAITTVSGIFMSPTIAIDKDAVNQGVAVTIFGSTAPNSNVTVTINSDEPMNFNIKADANGFYRYMLDTRPLELGEHQSKSRSTLNNMISPYSGEVYFRVIKPGESIITPAKPGVGFGFFRPSGSTTVNVTEPTKPSAPSGGSCGIPADLNKDCKINLVDFSILSFWYQRKGVPANIDLNKDKKITLADFSILAYYWKP